MPTSEPPAEPIEPVLAASSADQADASASASTTSGTAVWTTGTSGAAGPATPPAGARPSPWPARGHALLAVLSRAERWIAGRWNQPKIRSAVIGTVLVVLGAAVLPSSVWTLPITIFGAILLLIASVGSRLDGRFAVDWGEHGTQIEFRAAVNSSAPRPAHGLRLAPVPEEPQVIEGEAHTVEIDVGELKALIAAAEAETRQPLGTIHRSR